jgi:hypothetical protein
VVCDKALFIGRLAGDRNDERLVWFIDGDGSRVDVNWPRGFGVRFGPEPQLIGPDGVQIAGAGEAVRLGGGFGASSRIFNACEVNGRDWFSSAGASP